VRCFTVAVATALGASLLRDSCEDLSLRFVTGAAALSLAVFCLCAAQLAYPLVFAILAWRTIPVALSEPSEPRT